MVGQYEIYTGSAVKGVNSGSRLFPGNLDTKRAPERPYSLNGC